MGLSYTDKSGDDLMKAIRQERKVELAYEGHYYWDMRRWKLSATAFTGIRPSWNENREKCKWVFHLHLYRM